MSLKMKKSNLVIVSAAALMLAGVLAGLVSCQMGIEDLPLPPIAPNASIVKGADGTNKYVLEWKRDSGILYQDADYDAVSIEHMEDALTKWQLYTRMIDPRPFYDPPGGTGIAPDPWALSGLMNNPYEVGTYDSSWKIYNEPSYGTVVIHRYWPTNIPDVATWVSSEDSRRAAFKKAVAEIESMQAAIKASSLYDTGRVDPVTGIKSRPLLALYEAMADCIAYNPPSAACIQRQDFNWDNGRVVLPPDESGWLYEYYMGFAPDHNYYDNPAGDLALPE
ncbi:hypothetical protein AGMMS49579_03340 [Spirochaetia bacterium]|nr:hypothetical protein AGMMS49579_03340 [Spirochaetia bacterium]